MHKLVLLDNRTQSLSVQVLQVGKKSRNVFGTQHQHDLDISNLESDFFIPSEEFTQNIFRFHFNFHTSFLEEQLYKWKD